MRFDVAEMQEPRVVALFANELDADVGRVRGLRVLLANAGRQVGIARVPTAQQLAVGPVTGNDEVFPRILAVVAVLAEIGDVRMVRPRIGMTFVSIDDLETNVHQVAPQYGRRIYAEAAQTRSVRPVMRLAVERDGQAVVP